MGSEGAKPFGPSRLCAMGNNITKFMYPAHFHHPAQRFERPVWALEFDTSYVLDPFRVHNPSLTLTLPRLCRRNRSSTTWRPRLSHSATTAGPLTPPASSSCCARVTAQGAAPRMLPQLPPEGSPALRKSLSSAFFDAHARGVLGWPYASPWAGAVRLTSVRGFGQKCSRPAVVKHIDCQGKGSQKSETVKTVR